MLEWMALSGLHFNGWNQSAPPRASDRYMRLGVGLGFEWYHCNSTRGKSQPWALYLATLQGDFSQGCRRALKSVSGCLLPCHLFFLTSHHSLAHFVTNISTQCRRIHSALSKLPTSSQLSNLSNKSATAVSQCRGPSVSCVQQFCPQIMDQYLFLRNPATHTFFHLLNTQ